MQAEAIVKLRTEMNGAADNVYVQVIGDFLLGHVKRNPQDAEKMLAADKTIIKSLDEMRKEAKKKESGGVAMLKDDEAYAIVLKYFGVEKPATAEKDDFDVDLDALLGV